MLLRVIPHNFAAVWLALGSLTLSVNAASEEDHYMATIQDYRDGISRVHARNPEVKIQISQDPEAPGESVLTVDYPASTGRPAERDVWCDAIDTDWTVGTAIVFKAKSPEPLRISVSFLGHNKVAYTTWADLKAGEWQTVRIELDEIQPNPYFQPPGADKGSPIDVSEVARIGFAPQTAGSGQLTVGRFTIIK